MTMFTRVAAAIAPLLLLSGCLLSPGKFTSSLDIRKDGTFSFAYVGEVIVAEPSGHMPGMTDEDEDKASPPAKSAQAAKETAAKTKAIADALAKEKGFRSVRVTGSDRLNVDYRIDGRLDHSFVFPFNVDAKAIIPFLAIEVRADGKVRMLAPGFGEEASGPAAGPMSEMGGGGGAKQRNGTFTLTTDAEIVSQNQEDGAKDGPRGKQIVWTITPETRVAPMAVLKLAR